MLTNKSENLHHILIQMWTW